jgi:ribosome-binding ATPase
MGWSCGIVGLPNAGKSTLFKALTTHQVTIAAYPFSTVEPNKAVVALPDSRLVTLAELCKSDKITPAALEIIDVAGLVSGASRGEGLGNQFLGHLRNVDLLIHVIAAYDQENSIGESLHDRRDIINLELALADLETIKRRMEKNEPKLKSGDLLARSEMELLGNLEDHLNRGQLLLTYPITPDEKDLATELSLLSLKKMIYVYNYDEKNDSKTINHPLDENTIAICGRLEAELVDLPSLERDEYLQAYGLKTSMIGELLEKCFSLLNLLTFYTVKGSEARAWVAPKGIKAVNAAGKIHTDMERGFINAEVIPWDQFPKSGSLTTAREKGLTRTEGKDYIVQDGEVLFVRFKA